MRNLDPTDTSEHDPQAAETALLLIDVINDLEFEGGERLLVHALPMAQQIRTLKANAKRAGVPVIYANDNFGRWRSDFPALVRHCTEDQVRGSPVAKYLAPDDEDYFVLKPRHSAFFQTNLELLLQHLGVRRLILTGMATDMCVLFSANDAYMRGFEIVVASDCVAAEDAEQNAQTVALMQRVLKAEVMPAAQLRLRSRVER